ncbi:MAG: hypothetical protein ABIJ09_15335 [Pseudomonadota bacterium]
MSLRTVTVAVLGLMVFATTGCAACVERAPSGGKAAGELCLSSAECLAGLRCVGGVCAQPAADGGEVDAAGLDAATADRTATDLALLPDGARLDAAQADTAASPDRAAADSASEPDSAVHVDASGADSAVPPDATTGVDVAVTGCSPFLSPNSLDLGTVYVGSTASVSAAVANQGTGPCVITGVQISPSDGSLRLLEPEALPVVLEPLFPSTNIVTLRLLWAPAQTGALSATVSVLLQDYPPLTLSLTGSASPVPGGACVGFSSSLMDFGTLPTSCTAHRWVLIVNQCTTLRRVSGLSLVGNEVFSLATAAPVEIAAGSSAPIAVWAGGGVQGMASARLSATLEGGGSVPGEVEILADFAGAVVDTYTQGGDESVDLFIVVDDSGSMDPAQAQLARDLSALIGEFDALGVDYHVGVTTTDMDGGPEGQFIPLSESVPVVTSSSLPDPSTRLTAAVTPGASGSAYEMGFDATLAALSLPLLAGRNAGFLRPDALLAVLYLSNEEEQSATSVASTREFLRGLKAHLGPNAVSVGALVGLPGDTCDPATDVGQRYLDLVDQASGVRASICAPDWTPLLRELVRLGAGRRASFFLSSTAQATPEVRVDGALKTLGVDFAYSAANRAVTFEPNRLPLPGQRVTLSYSSACP